MTDLRKAAEMALEALEWNTSHRNDDNAKRHDAIEALRQVIEQAEKQEPVEPPDYVEPITYDYHDGWEAGFKAGVDASKHKQEPYCWVQSKLVQGTFYREKPRRIHTIPLYTAPPQREWVGLTEAEMTEVWESTDSEWEMCMRVQAALKEKNT